MPIRKEVKGWGTCLWPTGDTEARGFVISQADSRPTDQSHPLAQLSLGLLVPTKSWTKMSNDCRLHNCVYSYMVDQDLPWSDLPGGGPPRSQCFSNSWLWHTVRNTFILCVSACVYLGGIHVAQCTCEVREQLAGVHSLLLLCGFREINSGHKLGGKCHSCWTVLLALKPRFWKSKLCLQWPIKKKNRQQDMVQSHENRGRC